MSALAQMPLERLRDAELIVRGRLAPTPLLALGERTTLSGSPILLKVESLQPTGSFKVRGALNRIERLTPPERAAGVIAYSTGNHAQAVAWAARAATRHLSPATRVIGVEPEPEADAWQSFHAGELRRLDGPSDSIADAVKVQELGRLTWPLIRDCVDDVVTVTEADIAGACRLAANLAHLVVEPGGALGIAAALRHRDRAQRRPTVALACGGNIDLGRLAAIGTGEAG